MANVGAHGQQLECGADGPRSLPQEGMPAMLELLDAASLAQLRRASHSGSLDHEMHVAELRALVLELLTTTTFPFTHAAYVLGLNGPYYSYDTVAKDHYGIPAMLPQMICRLFRLAVPDVVFTTVRIQKLSAAANFGGKHRTLAFSLAAPQSESDDTVEMAEVEQEQAPAPTTCTGLHASWTDRGSRGYILCLSPGCTGGRGEVCEDIEKSHWRLLASPMANAKWIPFLRTAWLQLHWPQSGDLYAITVTCEPLSNRQRLAKHERTQMLATGFLLPMSEDDDQSSPVESSQFNDAFSPQVEDVDAALPRRQAYVRPAAVLRTACQVLGLDDSVAPTHAEVEEAFRRQVRVAHPDRGGAEPDTLDSLPRGGIRARTRGWAMSQISWARRVLNEAIEAEGADFEMAENDEAPQELLMLGAPNPGPDLF